jgi:DNA-binding GntR family transcriptional regulator
LPERSDGHIDLASEGSLTSVKGNVAAVLREEIIAGKLAPGERIVESKWANRLGVAQASVREALNILATEGFVQKELGRSARVTVLSEKDVFQIYEVRTLLQRLAARLVATQRPDLTELLQALADMRAALVCGNVRGYCDRTVAFHLLLCEKSGNRWLLEDVKRLIVPLFAFIVMRQHATVTDPAVWQKSLADHELILKAVQSGDPDLAEREVGEMIESFSKRTVDLLNEKRAWMSEAKNSASRNFANTPSESATQDLSQRANFSRGGGF